MDNKSSTIKERILQIAGVKGVTKEKFAEDLGMTYGNFKGSSKKTPINSNALATIFSMYPDINLEYLITGEGELLKEDNILTIDNEDKHFVSEDLVAYNIANHKRIKPKIYDSQRIPLYDSNATLGLEEIFHNTERGNILEYIAIPNLPKSDGAILMTGDSMYPLLKSGDIAILKIINKDDMVFGDIHYIEYFGKRGGDPLKTIKYVRKSEKGEDYIKLIAYNSHHDPDDIEIKKIKTVAILNASVRYHRL